VRKLSHPSYCRKCGTPLKPQSQFCPRCGKEVTTILPPVESVPLQPAPQGPVAPYQPQPNQIIHGVDNRILILAIIIVILVLPIFPVTKTVMVSGTTQSVTNTTSFSTSLEVITQPTASQISVYTGTFQYFSNYYNSYPWYYYGGGGGPWWGRQCFWRYSHIVCNWSQWGWYQPSYGTTVTVTPDMNVVNVIRTQQSYGYGYSESLILVYYNGQQSQTYQNVYADNLAASGTSTISGTTVVTNTLVNTVVNPVTMDVPCDQCMPTTVTEHVSILQYLLGYY